MSKCENCEKRSRTNRIVEKAIPAATWALMGVVCLLQAGLLAAVNHPTIRTTSVLLAGSAIYNLLSSLMYFNEAREEARKK